MKNQTIRAATLKNLNNFFAHNEEGPVSTVQKVCRIMKSYPRKIVVKICVDAGINPATARTQYQKWYSKHH